MRVCALFLEDTELLAKLSGGDIVALKAKYRMNCLMGLYNRARRAKQEEREVSGKEDLPAIAFAVLVMYIE